MDRTNIQKITSKSTKPVFLCSQTKPESMNVTVYRRMDIFVMFSVPSLNSRHLKVCFKLKNLIYCWYIGACRSVLRMWSMSSSFYTPKWYLNMHFFFNQTRKFGILNMIHAVNNMDEFMDLLEIFL